MFGTPSPIEKLDPATSKPAQQDVLPGNIDPETAVLTKAPNGNFVLAPQNPKSSPGITVFAPKK
ncbi:hypothetical protein ABIA39_004478 [Nocardia sp. GAS34]|uniref:hypothetical protein n=1 Tax=unclassified Nocardia TaxID=2637762 RepID=UPI003D1AAC80